MAGLFRFSWAYRCSRNSRASRYWKTERRVDVAVMRVVKGVFGRPLFYFDKAPERGRITEKPFENYERSENGVFGLFEGPGKGSLRPRACISGSSASLGRR